MFFEIFTKKKRVVSGPALSEKGEKAGETSPFAGHLPALGLLGMAAFAAGVCNGLLGTGGGMLLWFALSCYGVAGRRVFALTSATVLCFSLLSAGVYFAAGRFGGEALSCVLPALLGGALGGVLLGRFPMGALKNLFAAVLVFSGVMLCLG